MTYNIILFIGNEKLHTMTSLYQYELRIGLEDFEGKTGYAEYAGRKKRQQQWRMNNNKKDMYIIDVHNGKIMPHLWEAS
jgi:hypothetical protein